MNRELLSAELIRDEDLRLKPYRCTAGKLTIGVGRNIEDVGISKEEALFLLMNDMTRCEADLRNAIPAFDGFPENVQRALCNMVFNMGINRVMQFRNMLDRLNMRDWAGAADEALDSKWAAQVGDRAKRVAELMRSA